MAKQSITAPSYAVNNVQSLPTEVKNQAVSVKQTFDKVGLDGKEYLANTLIPELNGNDGSKKIGHSSLNVTANNVADALEEIKQDLVGISQGSVADGAITNAKLSNDPGDIKATVTTLQESVTALTPFTGALTIFTTGWVANAGDNTLKYNLAINDVLATSWVDISIDRDYQDVALDAEINPTIVEYDGGVTIYANTVPSVPIPIKYKVSFPGAFFEEVN